MKKRLFSVILLCSLLLTGCHEENQEPVTGEIYDTGQFQVLVPETWRVLPITDPFQEGRPVMTDCVFLRKGGESDWKVTEKPYIRIECYSEEREQRQIPQEYLQHNAREVVPMELGRLTWQGYTADDYQGRVNLGRFAVLWAEDEQYIYQVYIWFESGGEKISLEDRDLQAILASVTCTIGETT